MNRGDAGSATDCLEELRKHSSPNGNSMERMAHYFREALVRFVLEKIFEYYNLSSHTYCNYPLIMHTSLHKGLVGFTHEQYSGKYRVKACEAPAIT